MSKIFFFADNRANLFKSCFCPGKASVFGIEKQNQDVYSKEELTVIINKTIITRKFWESGGKNTRFGHMCSNWLCG